ncbi:MAG: PIN domain-containing protein [Acidobacteriia bacterium]|nr:PIN domain-containing protein [Terriglobia bacterium]
MSRAREPDQHVDRWLKTTTEESRFSNVLTFAEIRRGIELPAPGKPPSQLEQWQEDLIVLFEARLLPVTKAVADRWAVISAQTQRKGITLANIDGLIAATALEHDLTLLTPNVRDFVGVEVPLVIPGKLDRF